MFVPNNDDFQLMSEEGRKLTFQVLLPFFSIKKRSQSFVQFLLLVTLSVNSNKAKEKQQKPFTLSRRKSSVSCFNTSRRCIYCVWHLFHSCYSKIMVYQENYPWNCLNSFSSPQFRPAGLGIWQYLEASLSSDL